MGSGTACYCCLFVFVQSITLASAKAVAAGKSCKPADVSACANMSRNAIHDLLLASKGASKCADSDDDRDR